MAKEFRGTPAQRSLRLCAPFPPACLPRTGFCPCGFTPRLFRIRFIDCVPWVGTTAWRGNFMLVDTNGIQKILPHRYPFLMVDSIIEMERLKRIVGLKNVTINEGFFAGHFPGKPVMPGVLIVESMAQTGGFLLLQEVKERDSKLLYFVAIDDARFRRPVVPGDQLRVEVDVLQWRNTFCKLAGKALVGGELAAEATLMCKMIDRDP
jgi:3-hydroxyacyl-[acyl-carrier-protein] dehydratase